MDGLTTVILAAGEGKRMRSRTPKVLHPLCGRPLISYPLRLAQTLADRVVMVVGPNAEGVRALAGDVPVGAATEEDYAQEFLALILAVRVVDSADAAIEHIATYGSGHSEAIVTGTVGAARAFQLGVDAAVVYVNASTRYTDGGEFGMGAEIGNSTQKLHARGPIGLRELCAFKYLVEGTGQVRA